MSHPAARDASDWHTRAQLHRPDDPKMLADAVRALFRQVPREADVARHLGLPVDFVHRALEVQT